MYRWKLASLVAVLVVCWAFASGFSQDQVEDDTEPVLEYARDADTVVIMMDAVGLRDEIPILRIFGDGRVVVHRQTVDDREMFLSSQEIDVWLRYLYGLGVLTFDRDAAKQKILEIRLICEAEAKARGQTEFTGTFIPYTYATTIKVNLKAFKPSGIATPRVDNYTHQLIWMHPRFSAKEFPEVPELAGLAEATEALLDLTRHSDLVRVDEE